MAKFKQGQQKQRKGGKQGKQGKQKGKLQYADGQKFQRPAPAMPGTFIKGRGKGRTPGPNQMQGMLLLGQQHFQGLLEGSGVWIVGNSFQGRLLHDVAIGTMDGGPETAAELWELLGPIVRAAAAVRRAEARAAQEQQAVVADVQQAGVTDPAGMDPAHHSGNALSAAQAAQRCDAIIDSPEQQEPCTAAGQSVDRDMGAASAEPTAGAPSVVMPDAFGTPAGPEDLQEDQDPGGAASPLGEVPGRAGEAASAAGQVTSPLAQAACQAEQPVAAEPAATSPPVTEDFKQVPIYLSLFEAVLMQHCLGCLAVHRLRGASELQAMTDEELWQAANSMRPGFHLLYVAYQHYRSLGWIPRCGLQFGCDWVIYDKHPAHTHSNVCVLVLPVAGTPTTPAAGPGLLWKHLEGTNRLVTRVAKKLMLFYVEAAAGTDIGSLGCLRSFKVLERIVDRWVPESNTNKLDRLAHHLPY